ncbi:MAG: hypothetical protein HPY55_04030 [Firmicutes bacterium]|nr:hypothetical protein [Bacillota bacterium]
MIERAKSVTLTVLVLLSLVLTGRLMLGFQGPARSPEQPFQLVVAEKPKVDIKQALRPSRIVVHLGGNQHTVLYPGGSDYTALWDTGLISRAVLGEVSGVPRESPVDLRALRTEQGSIEVILPVRLPFSQWMVIWTGYPWTEGPDFMCDRLAISTGKTPAVFAYSYRHDRYLRFDLRGLGRDSSILLSQLRDVMRKPPARYVEAPTEINGVSIDRGVFLPLDLPVATLMVKPEPLVPDQILQKFFLDRSVVRRIEEKDGAVIYSDGRQGLRIYRPGAIEYTCPLVTGDASGMDELTVLERSLEFVATHGGLPDGAFLLDSMGRVHKLSGGLSEVQFSYSYRGIPVWGNDSPISVTLSSQGTESYRRCVRVVVGPSAPANPTVPGAEALNIVTRHWGGVFPEWVTRSIRDVYYAYWSLPLGERQEALKLVWVIETATGPRAFVDARSGAVWGEERAR